MVVPQMKNLLPWDAECNVRLGDELETLTLARFPSSQHCIHKLLISYITGQKSKELLEIDSSTTYYQEKTNYHSL